MSSALTMVGSIVTVLIVAAMIATVIRTEIHMRRATKTLNECTEELKQPKRVTEIRRRLASPPPARRKAQL